MHKRTRAIIRFAHWLFTPPVPAIEVGSATIAAGWALAFALDPLLIMLPSYRVFALLPRDIVVAGMALLSCLSIAAAVRPQLRTGTCLASGFAWCSIATGFVSTHAWPGVVTYSTLGIGALLAAIYAETLRGAK